MIEGISLLPKLCFDAINLVFEDLLIFGRVYKVILFLNTVEHLFLDVFVVPLGDLYLQWHFSKMEFCDPHLGQKVLDHSLELLLKLAGF